MVTNSINVVFVLMTVSVSHVNKQRAEATRSDGVIGWYISD